MRFLLAAVLLLSAPAAAAAGARVEPAMTGHELARLCASPSDLDYGFCAGYVSAVAHAMLADSLGGRRACGHGLVRSQQLVDTFTAFARAFPARLSGGADDAVAAALARAFPCPS